MSTKLHVLIIIGAALAVTVTSPALAHASTESPTSKPAAAGQTAKSSELTNPLIWSPWCCAALKQASIWAGWRYRAARQRFYDRAAALVVARNAYFECRSRWFYWYYGPTWFAMPRRNAWVPYWPNRCWPQLIAHRRAVGAYVAAKIRMQRAYYDWRWAQRRYRMCLQFERWPSYYGLDTTAAMSSAARVSPSGAATLIAPSGSPDSK